MREAELSSAEDKNKKNETNEGDNLLIWTKSY